MERWKKMVRQIGILYILAWLFLPVWGQEIESVTQPVGIGIFDEVFHLINDVKESVNIPPHENEVTYDSKNNIYKVEMVPGKEHIEFKKIISGSYTISAKITFSPGPGGYVTILSLQTFKKGKKYQKYAISKFNYIGLEKILTKSLLFADGAMAWSYPFGHQPVSQTENVTIFHRSTYYADLHYAICEVSEDGEEWESKRYQVNFDENYTVFLRL